MGYKAVYPDDRYGLLTVVSASHTRGKLKYWNCVCDCGAEVVKSTNYLRHKPAPSCGCRVHGLVVGNTYGIYTVIDTTPIRKAGYPAAFYRVQCECGQVVERTRNQLRGLSGQHKSCCCKAPKWTTMTKGVVVNGLTIIGDTVTKQGRNRYIDCLCVCGNIRPVNVHTLVVGRIQSCGCKLTAYYQASTVHGLSGNRLYHTWTAMMERCYNTNSTSYPNYGGRGITVDPELQTMEGFVAHLEASYVEGYTLDRIDNNGNYTPSNVRWATVKTQNNNRRNTIYVTDWFTGEHLPLSIVAERYGIRYPTLMSRHRSGKTGFDLLDIRSSYYYVEWPFLSRIDRNKITSVITNNTPDIACKLLDLPLLDVLIIKEKLSHG